MTDNTAAPAAHSRGWVELLRSRAASQGDQLAYRFLADGERDESALTYAQLDARARAIGAWLAITGASGRPVLLIYPPGLEFVAALFGCWYAGAVAVPCHAPRPSRPGRKPTATLAGIAADAAPAVALTVSKMVETVAAALSAGGPSSVPCRATDTVDLTLSAQWSDPRTNPDALACLQYTSGSTAAPRGVMVTHANLLHNSAVIRDAFGHTPASRGVIWLPAQHDMGLVGGILQPLFVGFPVTLMPPAAFLQRPRRWLEAIARFGGTTSGGPNFAYELCTRAIPPEQRDGLDLSTWDVAFTGAEPVRAETIDRFAAAFGASGFRRTAFYPCYGLAEATLLVTGGDKRAAPVLNRATADGLRRHAIEPAPPSAPTAGVSTLVGCGLPRGAEVRIVDPQTRRPLSAGRVGEIWVRGPGVARGYWSNPALTAATFAAQLDGDASGAAFLRTGDLGALDAATGEVSVTGRLKDLIIVDGVNYYPHDLERAAEQSHPDLQPDAAAAFAVDVGGRERVVVAIELTRGADRAASLDATLGAVRAGVAAACGVRPVAVALLAPGRLPRTPSGKVRRLACRDALADESLETLALWREATPAATATAALADVATSKSGEDAVRAIIARLTPAVAAAVDLPPQQIDPCEPLARYGLDSAGAVALACQLEAELNVELPATLFWDYPTLDALARYLTSGEATLVTAGVAGVTGAR